VTGNLAPFNVLGESFAEPGVVGQCGWMELMLMELIWLWVKTLVPSKPQNSWQMDVHPTKNVSIGIDPYPYNEIFSGDSMGYEKWDLMGY